MLKKMCLPTYMQYLRKNARIILGKFFGLSSEFKKARILEIGSGFCGIISVIKADSKVGIDPIFKSFPNMVGIRDGAIYHPSKAEDFNIQRAVFDVVFCSNTLNHVENPNLVLKNCRKAMKKGADLYLDVHIQKRSLIHPHRFSEESVRSLISKYFKIVEEFNSNSKELFGEGDTKIWGCHARKL